MSVTCDPHTVGSRDYVVPLPRVTDAIGGALRRRSMPAGMPEPIATLLRRLDETR